MTKRLNADQQRQLMADLRHRQYLLEQIEQLSNAEIRRVTGMTPCQLDKTLYFGRRSHPNWEKALDLQELRQEILSEYHHYTGRAIKKRYGLHNAAMYELIDEMGLRDATA